MNESTYCYKEKKRSLPKVGNKTAIYSKRQELARGLIYHGNFQCLNAKGQEVRTSSDTCNCCSPTTLLKFLHPGPSLG